MKLLTPPPPPSTLPPPPATNVDSWLLLLLLLLYSASAVALQRAAKVKVFPLSETSSSAPDTHARSRTREVPERESLRRKVSFESR